MKFYSINFQQDFCLDEEQNAKPVAAEPVKVEPSTRLTRRKKAERVDDFNKQNRARGVAFPTEEDGTVFTVAMKNNGEDPYVFLRPLLERYEVFALHEAPKVKEIGLDDFGQDASRADEIGTIIDDGAIFRYLDLAYVQGRRYGSRFNDVLITDEWTKSDLLRLAEENRLGKDYLSELDRIYEIGKVEHFIGHPAHYLIVAKEHPFRKSVIRGLISALYEEGRVSSKRYTIVDPCEVSREMLRELYRVNRGGSIVLRFETVPEEISEGNETSNRSLEEIFALVGRLSVETLTLFSFDTLSDGERDAFTKMIAGMPLVEIRPDLYVKESAVAYVRSLAEKDGIEADRDLTSELLLSERGYLAEDLDDVYAKWKTQYVNGVLYPQYKGCAVYAASMKKEEGSALAELEELIGLQKVKSVVKESLAYFRMHKEISERGIVAQKPAMHMVFTGNPGTAKTTVARLVARIFKENGLLSVGGLVEVGRGDIVGKYVGHTAPNVKALFEKAKGSVLFIDEAYSLADAYKGSYGDEAISAIVQCMENYRNDTVVIFAGYPNEMKEFIERNPGLNSRIAFHVDFDDYDENELYEIISLIAKKNGMTIDEDAKEELLGVFRGAAQFNETFGNGRFARKLFEQARMTLATRLYGKDLTQLSQRDLTTLHAADFAGIESCKRLRNNKIGFGI